MRGGLSGLLLIRGRRHSASPRVRLSIRERQCTSVPESVQRVFRGVVGYEQSAEKVVVGCKTIRPQADAAPDRQDGDPVLDRFKEERLVQKSEGRGLIERDRVACQRPQRTKPAARRGDSLGLS